MSVVVLVMVAFFVISFVTNMLDPLMPTLRASFGINGFEAGLMAFAFFSAYGIMSIPAGLWIEQVGARIVLLSGTSLALVGALAFSLWPSYLVALPSLFTIAVGFAMLQVVINPLLRDAGGQENYALWANASQLIFGGASFLSPFVYAMVVTHNDDQVHQSNMSISSDMSWTSLYWLISGMLLVLLAAVTCIRIPTNVLQDNDRIGSLHTIRKLLCTPLIWYYFIGIFCYVGLEQGVALSIAQFLQFYHGIAPEHGGYLSVAWFWGSMLIGCTVGLLLIRLFDSRHVLIVFGVGGTATLLGALFLPTIYAQFAFPMMGFWCSIMWPVIFALALNSFRRQHGAIAGILCTGIIGGAVTPLIIGHLSDLIGLRSSMLVLLFALAYIIGIGIWARPLIRNSSAASQAIDRKRESARIQW